MPTLPVPLIYRMPGSFPSILHMANLGKTCSCNSEHLGDMLELGDLIEGYGTPYTEHNRVRNKGFKGNTHDGCGFC